jgi:hypothetical protein
LLEPDFTCVAAIRHRIAVEAAEGDQRAVLTNALARSLPRSEREKPPSWSVYYRTDLDEDRDLFRRLRLSIYANDEAEFVRLSKLFHRSQNHGYADDEEDGGRIVTSLLAKMPGDIPWLARRAPAIRDAVIAAMAAALVEAGAVRSDSIAVLDRLAPGDVASPAIDKALLWRDILAGKFDAARRRIAALAPEDPILAIAASAASISLPDRIRVTSPGFAAPSKCSASTRTSAGACLQARSACPMCWRCLANGTRSFTAKFAPCSMRRGRP